MRTQIYKRTSTKAERRFSEILKKNHIPYKFREKVNGREVDFILGTIAVEIGNHSQDVAKNKALLEAGYSLLFISNKSLRDSPDAIEEKLLDKWLKHV